jgi:hypothetical protein
VCVRTDSGRLPCGVCVQLVLGAGAMQVSGLKSISAKHLALANQAVSVVLALLPAVRAVLGALLPESRHLLLLSELDRLRQVSCVATVPPYPQAAAGEPPPAAAVGAGPPAPGELRSHRAPLPTSCCRRAATCCCCRSWTACAR